MFAFELPSIAADGVIVELYLWGGVNNWTKNWCFEVIYVCAQMLLWHIVIPFEVHCIWSFVNYWIIYFWFVLYECFGGFFCLVWSCFVHILLTSRLHYELHLLVARLWEVLSIQLSFLMNLGTLNIVFLWYMYLLFFCVILIWTFVTDGWVGYVLVPTLILVCWPTWARSWSHCNLKIVICDVFPF